VPYHMLWMMDVSSSDADNIHRAANASRSLRYFYYCLVIENQLAAMSSGMELNCLSHTSRSNCVLVATMRSPAASVCLYVTKAYLLVVPDGGSGNEYDIIQLLSTLLLALLLTESPTRVFLLLPTVGLY